MSFLLSPRTIEEEELLDVFELEKMGNQELYDHVLFLHNELKNKNNIIRMYKQYVENLKTEFLCTKCGEPTTPKNIAEEKVDFENELESMLQKEAADYTEYLTIKAEERVNKRKSNPFGINWKNISQENNFEDEDPNVCFLYRYLII